MQTLFSFKRFYWISVCNWGKRSLPNEVVTVGILRYFFFKLSFNSIQTFPWFQKNPCSSVFTNFRLPLTFYRFWPKDNPNRRRLSRSDKKSSTSIKANENVLTIKNYFLLHNLYISSSMKRFFFILSPHFCEGSLKFGILIEIYKLYSAYKVSVRKTKIYLLRRLPSVQQRTTQRNQKNRQRCNKDSNQTHHPKFQKEKITKRKKIK